MAPVLRGYKRLMTHVFQFLDKIYCAHNDDQFIVSLCSTRDKTCMLATLVACVNSSGCVLPCLRTYILYLGLQIQCTHALSARYFHVLVDELKIQNPGYVHEK